MSEGFFFGDQDPEQQKAQRALAYAQALQQQGMGNPGSDPGAGMRIGAGSIIGALLAKRANKKLANLNTDREGSYTRALGNFLGPKDNSTWDAGPETDASGDPGQISVSPRVGASMAQRLGATMNPDLMRQMGPQIATQQMNQRTTLSPEDAQAAGFRPGSVVQSDPTGALSTVQQSDTKSPEALAQEEAFKAAPGPLAQAKPADVVAQEMALKAAPGPAPQQSVGMTPDAEAQAIRIERVKAEDARKAQMGDADTIEQTAQNIATYKTAPLAGFAMAKPGGQAIMARVTQLNPQYNAQNFTKSQQAYKDFGSGKKGDLTRSFNVSISHLGTLDKLTDALGNGDVQGVNALRNTFQEQFGSDAPTNFNAAKAIVGDEIIKAIVGSGGALADRENAQNQISAAKTPAQLKGVIKTYKELMAGQLRGLKQQYETSTMRNDFDSLLSDDAKSQLESIAAPQQGTAASQARIRYDANGNRIP